MVIKNNGTSALPSDTKVWFLLAGPGWEGHHWVGPVSVADLTAGGTVSYSFDWLVPSDAQAG